MKEVVGSYKSTDGKDYYNIALNITTGDYFLIKNASCRAEAEEIACKNWNIPYDGMLYEKIKIIFMGTKSTINFAIIPKKYHKFFANKEA